MLDTHHRVSLHVLLKRHTYNDHSRLQHCASALRCRGKKVMQIFENVRPQEELMTWLLMDTFLTVEKSRQKINSKHKTFDFLTSKWPMADCNNSYWNLQYCKLGNFR